MIARPRSAGCWPVFRQQPEYEQLRERVRETGRLRAVHRPRPEADTDRAVYASIEREIEDEVRRRFPGDVIKQAMLVRSASPRLTSLSMMTVAYGAWTLFAVKRRSR